MTLTLASPFGAPRLATLGAYSDEGQWSSHRATRRMCFSGYQGARALLGVRPTDAAQERDGGCGREVCRKARLALDAPPLLCRGATLGVICQLGCLGLGLLCFILGAGRPPSRLVSPRGVGVGAGDTTLANRLSGTRRDCHIAMQPLGSCALAPPIVATPFGEPRDAADGGLGDGSGRGRRAALRGKRVGAAQGKDSPPPERARSRPRGRIGRADVCGADRSHGQTRISVRTVRIDWMAPRRGGKSPHFSQCPGGSPKWGPA